MTSNFHRRWQDEGDDEEEEEEEETRSGGDEGTIDLKVLTKLVTDLQRVGAPPSKPPLQVCLRPLPRRS